MRPLPSGIGLGWRPETAWTLQSRRDLVFTEVIAEAFPRPGAAHDRLRERGVPVVPHGVTLGLGDASRPDRGRLRRLADTALAYGSPLVSEHVAFVRGGGREAGHLLPVPRTADVLDILVQNVRIAMDALPVPLALENIAAPLGWPDDTMEEADFLGELVDRTGALLLLDLSNLYANALNRGRAPEGDLDALIGAVGPERIAYLHLAGGVRRGRWWHDTHAHPIGPDALALLGRAVALGVGSPVLLERDRGFLGPEALGAELDAIAHPREAHLAR